MKFSVATAFLASIAAASPLNMLMTRNMIARRQATEKASIGYATQNGGTTGGAAGETVTVKTLAAFKEAVGSDGPKIIIVSGAISGAEKVRIAADKTIYGESGSSLTGIGLYVRQVKNVIIRNLKISKVLAANGDCIGIDASSNIWIDHVDLSGDLSATKDDYDGLVDISHASEWVTITNSFFHDHWKASLIGHSDSNAAEDTGHLHVTYANNYWHNVNSRQPLVRFGTVHIINNYWEKVLGTGVNTRMGAQVLIQSSAFKDSAQNGVFFADSKQTGYAVLDDVDLGGSTNTAPKGTLTASKLPYAAIKALGSASVSSVAKTAGQTL